MRSAICGLNVRWHELSPDQKTGFLTRNPALLLKRGVFFIELGVEAAAHIDCRIGARNDGGSDLLKSH